MHKSAFECMHAYFYMVCVSETAELADAEASQSVSAMLERGAY